MGTGFEERTAGNRTFFQGISACSDGGTGRDKSCAIDVVTAAGAEIASAPR
jgi:hypothetical protein